MDKSKLYPLLIVVTFLVSLLISRLLYMSYYDADVISSDVAFATYTTKNFADTSLEKVKARLNSEKFLFHKGYFPETAKGLDNEPFALVNMDADLYNPTKTGL